MHGTTFGGGPLACAVAIAVIDAIEKQGLLTHATEVGDYFQQQLRSLASHHEAIVDVRGKGLMLAAEVDSPELAKLVVSEMLKRHIVINCTSDMVLRFLPPYILEHTHVDTAIRALDEILTEHAAAFSGAGNHAAGGQNLG
jgi:acetylornithine aminotransferase/acetylornithine/N-succinyldiaminopimelate aminotransferase